VRARAERLRPGVVPRGSDRAGDLVDRPLRPSGRPRDRRWACHGRCGGVDRPWIRVRGSRRYRPSAEWRVAGAGARIAQRGDSRRDREQDTLDRNPCALRSGVSGRSRRPFARVPDRRRGDSTESPDHRVVDGVVSRGSAGARHELGCGRHGCARRRGTAASRRRSRSCGSASGRVCSDWSTSPAAAL
jgi:hypothetical protein